MNFIKEFADYNSLTLPKGIVLTNYERIKLNRIIADGLSKFYKIDRYQTDPIIIGDKVILPEYLFKAINNRTLLNKIVDDKNGEIVSGVTNKQELFNFIRENLFDLLHYDGKYFDYVYTLLTNTSKRGKKFENKSFIKFEETARKKGLDIKVETTSIDEDISGIDGFFFYKEKKFTIQVKPLVSISDYEEDNMRYIAYSKGDIRSIITDYLILTNERETWIFRSRTGVDAYDKESYFIISKENLVD
jgi:hypothetical protein